MRELTQVEYTYLWGDLHNDALEFADFLIDYNLAVPKRKQVQFYQFKRGRIPCTVVYREQLPQHFQDMLDYHESTLAKPFVGGCKVIPITATLR